MKKVHIVFGPQGAGKSTYSKKLSKEVGGVHLSIDQWMWTLYGADLPKSMNLKWIMQRVDRCEKLIWSITEQLAKTDCPAILDLGFTKAEKRTKFRQLSLEKNIPTQLHYIHAPHSIRKERVLERNTSKGDTFSFEVSPEMFDFMEDEFQNPTDEELLIATVINSNSY